MIEKYNKILAVVDPWKGEFKVDDIKGKIGGTSTSFDIKELLIGWTNFFLAFLGVIALVMIITGGIYMITSRGDEAKFKKGISFLSGAIIGIILIISAYTFVKLFIVN